MEEQHRILEQVAEWVDAGRVKTTLTEKLTPISREKLREAHGEAGVREDGGQAGAGRLALRAQKT